MKFGMNLLLWTGHLDESILPVLDQLKSMGYDGVEVPMFELDEEFYAGWGKRLDSMGLRRTAVTVRTEADNPISSDAAVRAAGVAANKRALDCCQALGAETVCGPFHSALGYFSGAGPTQDEWKWGVDSMRQVAQHAEKAGVTLAVEALNRFECYFLNCAADAARFVAEVNHPRCRMMYDTFHANIEEKSVAKAIQTAAPYLVHVHISENDRSTPGQGAVRWAENFDALAASGYDGWMVVEAFGLALPSIAAATKIWRRMYQSEEQLARDALAFMRSETSKRS
ncbi:MAG TPA: sugar phosphate isomerase/epimerase [Lacipirellula sp.]